MASKPRKLKARKHQITKTKVSKGNHTALKKRPAVVAAPVKMPPLRPKLGTFNKLSEVVEYAGHHTYLITRLRKAGSGTIPVTLGSGFLIGPNRIFTCAHVINNLKDPSKKLAQHEDGD